MPTGRVGSKNKNRTAQIGWLCKTTSLHDKYAEALADEARESWVGAKGDKDSEEVVDEGNDSWFAV